MTFVHAVNHGFSFPLRASAYYSFFLLLVLTSPPCLTRHASAQRPDMPSDEVIRIDANLVTIPVIVTNERGERVSGLGQSDFAAREDGSLVDITHFAAGTDRVALTFLLDASGSTRDVIIQQRETALALLARFGQNSRVAVSHFSSRVNLVVPFTNDTAEAGKAFRLPPLSGQRTAIFDAALAAAREFKAVGQQPTERRIIILISDGLDTASTVTAAEAVREANARDVSFYVIHLPLYSPRGSRLVARPASKGFRELASRTGGRFFTVGDARSSLNPRATYDLAPVFKAISDDLAGQYVLGYYPSSFGDAPRSRRLRVELTSPRQRKFRVRALREGYTLHEK